MLTETQRALNATTTEDVLNGRTVDAFATTRLAARAHAVYHGPVRLWAGRLWVLYQNMPVEVYHYAGNLYHEAY